MTNRTLVAVLCSLLLVYTPIAAPAAGTTSMLGQVMVKGTVKVNGMVTPSGTTVFSGDQVQTGTDTIAELVLAGGSKVLLPKSSAVALNNEAAQVIVNLQEGSLAVLSRTNAPAFVDANDARIMPAANTAVVLEVEVLGRSLKVLARRGSAIVETADKTLTVEEGKELDATMAPPSPQGPAGPRTAGRGKLETYVFITAVAAGLTGLVLGLVAIFRANPADCTVVSPSGPGSITCP